MTPSEALEQVAVEFEQRRAKLASAAAQIHREWRSARTLEAQRAGAVCEAELRAQINELTWAIDKLRERATAMRSEEAA